jgi:4-amino-4-deoxy-L-arabinose transferase-like glycosyltransferase
MLNRRHAKILFLHFLVLAGSVFFIGNGMRVSPNGNDKPPFHIDEAHKIAESYYYNLLFKKNEILYTDWGKDFYVRTNPPVAKYIFGAALSAGGYYVNDSNLQFDFERLWRNPTALRVRVPDAMLRITRTVSVVFGGLVCLLSFLICYRIAGIATGLISVTLLLGSPFFIDNARRGLTDMILLFFMLLIIPLVFWCLSVMKRFWRGMSSQDRLYQYAVVVFASILGGSGIALAAGTKLNGALAAPAFSLGVLVAVIRQNYPVDFWHRIRMALSIAIFANVAALIIFVFMNPYLHGNPFVNATKSLSTIHDWVIKQQIDPGEGLFDLNQKIAVVSYFTIGRTAASLNRVLGMVHLGLFNIWMISIICFIGLIRLAYLSAHFPGREGKMSFTRQDDAMVVLIWICIITMGIAFWLPLGWSRYMLPVYLAIVLVISFGFSTLPCVVCSISRLIAKRPRPKNRKKTLKALLNIVVLVFVFSLVHSLVNPALVPPNLLKNMKSKDMVLIYSQAIAEDPNVILPRYYLGLKLLKLGHYDTAVHYFSTALTALDAREIRSTEKIIQKGRLYLALGVAKTKAGDHVEADKAFVKFLEIIEKLKNSMVSNDKKVRSEFDRSIFEHAQLISESGMFRP